MPNSYRSLTVRSLPWPVPLSETAAAPGVAVAAAAAAETSQKWWNFAFEPLISGSNSQNLALTFAYQPNLSGRASAPKAKTVRSFQDLLRENFKFHTGYHLH